MPSFFCSFLLPQPVIQTAAAIKHNTQAILFFIIILQLSFILFCTKIANYLQRISNQQNRTRYMHNNPVSPPLYKIRSLKRQSRTIHNRHKQIFPVFKQCSTPINKIPASSLHFPLLPHKMPHLLKTHPSPHENHASIHAHILLCQSGLHRHNKHHF